MRLGDYDVLARVAVGGMGEVFRAVRRGDPYGRPVALKVIRADRLGDQYFLDMFRAEARVGMLVDHPNIVRVLEFGAADSVPYLVQELVEGVSLARLLGKRPLDPALASHVALGVLAGLDYAHRLRDADNRPLRLVHRDVGAGNVLVSGAGQVKLTDFGVVKLRGLSLTQVGEEKGNPTCMAPEQLVSGGARRAVDHRADVFAVGVLLYSMVEGQGPFRDVAAWLATGAPLQTRGPFAEIIKRAMSIDPDARYESAAAMAQAVADVVPSDPTATARLGQRVLESAQPEQPLGALASRIMADLFEQGADATPAVPHLLDVTPAVPQRARGEQATDTVPVGLNGAPNDTLRNTVNNTLNNTMFREEMPTESIPMQLDSDAISIANAMPALPAMQMHSPSLPLRWVALGLAVLAGSTLITIAWAVSDSPAAAQPAPATASRKPLVSPMPAPRPTAPRPAAATPAPARAIPRPSPPPPAPRPEPKLEVRTGLLTFDSEPWATVYLGRRKLGTTPFVRVAVPAGKQVLSLDVEDSGRRREVPVVIAPGGDKRVAIRLDQ